MSRYLGDVIWPTILLIAIVIPVFITYEPYILTNTHYDIVSSITQTLSNAVKNPINALSTYLLGDLAPYLYVVIAALLILNRRKIHELHNELGLSWKPLFGRLSIPIIIASALIWFLISGLIPLMIPIPQLPLTNILLLIYTLYPIAISEEMVFRGFMLNRLLPRNNPINAITAMPAVIIDAIYFTMAHVPVYLAVYGINNLIPLTYTLAYIFVYGIISGVIFISTRNVIPDIIIHWINDYLSIITVIYLMH
ncbi:CPBP family intramembrane glutamic endopeptidase [Vulcanisaeta distributa]|uniref:Abortive infection protein n=1 Tax=Vulcanisaeta distributa (strain DSM 14429 / JCM 11212 / NBRC 100878 / IC-017) TaxID=572478 RepID=E1QV16_VULDI|nr:CPBP family intramembrane glutamic endopeptidase [Vulcanisaeta distributa]ADN51207.1 Abortive infection protein [Vulcanisaeta distributa DSM 14429]